MTILALDQATKISGFSIWTDGKLNTWGHKEYTDDDVHIRVHKICLWIESLLDQYAPDELIIEEIHYDNTNIATFQKLAQLQGAIIELAQNLHIPCKVISPNEWRAQCHFLKGHEKKRQAQKKIAQDWVQENFNAQCTDDEADAICIGYAVTQTIDNEINWE